MARKGNQQKNGLDRHFQNHKKKTLESPGMVFPGEQLPDCSIPGSPVDITKKTSHAADENRIRQNFEKFQRKEKQRVDEINNPKKYFSMNTSINGSSPLTDSSRMQGEVGAFPVSERGVKYSESGLGYLLNRFQMKHMKENMKISGSEFVTNLRLSALSMWKLAIEWLEKQRPLLAALSTKICDAHDCIRQSIKQAYPVIVKWLIHFCNIIFLLSMVWLDCTLRGINSILCLGTTSFFSVIWCSILSVIAMVGMLKCLIALAIAAFVGVSIGFTLGLLVAAISGASFLWFCGSFWTTSFVIMMGGLAFMLNRERLALFVVMMYSIYCSWTYVGFWGLLLSLNLSFISSDILIYCLKDKINQHRRSNQSPEQSGGMEGQESFFGGEAFQDSFSVNGSGLSRDRNPGVPSTSGAEFELTSEDEIVRLLSCPDHYSVLGLPRYENVDVNFLKKEYRKKAMLVHPDKNSGNEKAAEAFKKLHNAYEVLLDSSKRKTYDDELRKEELLNYFCRSGEHSFFASGFGHSKASNNNPFGDSRRIECKRCNNFHVWVHVERSKSRARWCQDCKDFHQAKDGDGWVEQSSQPLFYGLLKKVVAPCAYVCADSKIYDATQWYICQGMRCPANTHKPSFHVNTGVTSKHNTGKGSTSSSQRNTGMPEESMTEEEFFKWWQNAVQAGVFDNFAARTSAESPSAKAGSGPKSSGGGNGGGNKRKKRGKKQW